MRLEVRQLDQFYDSSQTLRAVSLTVDDGACLALLGRNGAGKTTLLRCIMGVLPVARGGVFIDGEDVTRQPSHRRARRGIGYVPQGREIFAELTVGDNLAVALEAHGVQKRRPALERVFELFPVLAQMRHRYGGSLSGGQQQQLAIARALVVGPRLLILDEPTEGIQPSIVQHIQTVIAGLKGEMSILMVEQYYDFAQSLADRYAVLARGAIVAQGEGAAMDSDGVQAYLSV
ncbi:MAG: urea ABC transporter ATP-binding subunit UrtE [Candidatus Competibacterales bacterium]